MELKVVHIFRSYLPYTENWLYNLINNTKNSKHVIFAERLDPGIFYNPNFTFYGNQDDNRSKNDKNLIILFLNKIKNLIYPFEKNEYSDYLESVIKKENPSVIHVHFAIVAMPYMKLFLTLNQPIVISFYGFDYKPNNKYKLLFSKASKVLCEGNAGMEQLKLLGCPQHKIECVPLGIVPPKKIVTKTKKRNQLRLLQIASFNEKKGHIYTLKAFEKALPDCPGMTLTLLGPNSQLKSEISKYIFDKNLTSNITISNAISPDQLDETFNNFDVFIHPSVVAKDGDNEGGAPVVLLNAHSNGLPVIATFHKDIPSYVLHQKTGLLASEKNITDLSQHIQTFYKMGPEEFSLYSKNASEHVLKNYNIVENAKKLSFIYKEISK